MHTANIFQNFDTTKHPGLLILFVPPKQLTTPNPLFYVQCSTSGIPQLAPTFVLLDCQFTFSIHLPKLLRTVGRMGEVVNAIVAVAVIVFIFRWATSGSSSSSAGRSATAALGFRPKNVTQQMVDQIHTMFPDIPTDNIRFDLLRTGSVELTSNKILERGFLEAPPQAYFALYPRADTPAAPRPSDPAARTTPNSSATTPRQSTLIERYSLENKVTATSTATEAEGGAMDAGGKAMWEDTPEKREASLRERKAQMILAARQRMLAQQQKEAAAGSGSS